MRTPAYHDIADGLPETCFSVLLSEPKKVILLKRGESGYYEISEAATIENAEQAADELNARRGVTAAQRQAMEIGSCFGWHVPGADPNRYTADGGINDGIKEESE